MIKKHPTLNFYIGGTDFSEPINDEVYSKLLRVYKKIEAPFRSLSGIHEGIASIMNREMNKQRYYELLHTPEEELVTQFDSEGEEIYRRRWSEEVMTRRRIAGLSQEGVDRKYADNGDSYHRVVRF